MCRIRELTLGAVSISIIISAGCSTLKPDTPSYNNDKNPIVGLWFSESPDSVTYFIFYENLTFTALSRSGADVPDYRYQYLGTWDVSGGNQYTTTGQHIGYGEVTALAIWRDLTILYDPASDTFTIPVYDNQEFHRISKIPEEPGIV
jgi:hypothetical protein